MMLVTNAKTNGMAVDALVRLGIEPHREELRSSTWEDQHRATIAPIDG